MDSFVTNIKANKEKMKKDILNYSASNIFLEPKDIYNDILNGNDFQGEFNNSVIETNFKRTRTSKSKRKNSKEEIDFHNSNKLIYSYTCVNKEKTLDEIINIINISDIENIQLNEFDEKNIKYPRKYTIDTKRCGQKYFIYRYLKWNLKEIDKESLGRKNFFLIITIEKSIFYFNLKRYKDCINLLLDEEIIKNKVEFGEFLLVISGYDKNIITEFLSDKNNIEILDKFISCIYMDYNSSPLMNTIKFLLSCLNFPNKEIIDSFSLKYFDSNKNNKNFMKIFKEKEAFNLLVHNMIIVNDIFIGKEKDKNKFIKLEQFIKINKELEKKFVQNIYKELQSNPIYPSDNYMQKMYKKLTLLVKEEDENEIIDKNKDADSFYEKLLDEKPKRGYDNYNIWFSLRKNISNFNKNDEEILLKPTFFIKFVRNSTTSHPRVFAVQDNFTNLIWGKSLEKGKIKGGIHNVKIEEISDIYVGVSHCEILEKYLKNIKELDSECNYFTIKTKTDVIVIKSDNKDLLSKWLKALKSLVYKNQKIKEKEKEKINIEKKNKIEFDISKIWEDYICKKWTDYGRYLIYKKNNKIEYKQVFSATNKKEKIIKSELIDEKLKFNSKKINIFINGLKNKLSGKGKEENILDYNEFLFLFKIGIPHKIRHIIWDTLIDNLCGITKDIYEFYSQQIEKIDLNKKIKEYRENRGNRGNSSSLNNDEELINKIILDILKAQDLFSNELGSIKDINEFLAQVYRIIRVFFMMRIDIPYNKGITNYAFFFKLIFNDEYICYKNMYNFICSSNIVKYFSKNEVYIENNCRIFDFLMKKYIPKIYAHLNNLDFGNELFIIQWFENLFTETLDYKILLRVFDLFLINGDELFFQIGLTIIKLQEEELLNYPINELFKLLKRLPSKFDEETFFECSEQIKIEQKYNNFIVKNNLLSHKDFLSWDE